MKMSNRSHAVRFIALFPLLVSGCEDSATVPGTPPATMPAYDVDTAETPGDSADTQPATALEWPTPPDEPMETGPHGGQLVPLPGELGFVEWQPDRRRIHLLTRENNALQVTSIHASATGEHGPRDVSLVPCEQEDRMAESCLEYEPRPGEGRHSLLLRLRVNQQGIAVKLIPPDDNS